MKEQEEEGIIAGFYLPLVKISAAIYKSQFLYV